MLAECFSSEVDAVRSELLVEMADTPEAVKEAYRLRHQVYCLEREYEAGRDGMETDEFDAQSRHVVIRRRSSGQVLGTVRLVLPRLSKIQDSFPIQSLVAPSLLAPVPLRRAGEVSRFAISKDRRGLDGSSMALMRLGLIQGAVRLSTEAGHTHWLAVMEPTLLRLLRATGLHFEPVGPLVDYHGRRQPVYADLAKLLERMKQEKPDVWSFITGAGQWATPEPQRLPLAA